MSIYLPIIIALVLYFSGIPIAYALIAGTLYFFGFVDTTSKVYLLLQKFITSTQSFPFLAIPFFIMAGSIMNYAGMSDKLMAFADALTGHRPGGLAQINVLLSMLMGGCSGSANADAAMECKMLVPEMEKRGYGKGFSAAITAASSCITPIIPPGINLIVYGLIAGASVGKLFAAGYIPGFIMAITLMIAVNIISKKRGYAPSREKRAKAKEIAKHKVHGIVLSGGTVSRSPMTILGGAMPYKTLAHYMNMKSFWWLKAALNFPGVHQLMLPTEPFKELYFMDKAKIFQEAFKDSNIPLIYVGGVQSGDNCQQIMDEGFELFQIAHVLIKDPDFVKHIQENPHYHAGCGRSNYCVGRMYSKDMKCHECVLRDGEPIAPRIQREIEELEANAKKSVAEQKK